jgi:hypothetical protein
MLSVLIVLYLIIGNSAFQTIIKDTWPITKQQRQSIAFMFIHLFGSIVLWPILCIAFIFKKEDAPPESEINETLTCYKTGEKCVSDCKGLCRNS